METVSIVTEAAAPSDSDDEPLKPAGFQFAVGHEAAVRSAGEAPSVSPPAAAVSQPKSPAASRPLRTAVLFMAFAVLGVGATLALNSSPLRDWWLTLFQNDAEAYAAYIDQYQNTDAPQLEKAYYRKADKTGALPDLRNYITEYPQGQYREPVLEKIKALETQAIASIRQHPDPEKIRQFASDFPESPFLAEIGAAGQDTTGNAALENNSQTPDEKTIAAAAEQSAGAPGEPSKTQKEQPQTGALKPVILNRRSGLNMTSVQGGTFTMGDNSDKAACPHSVTVKNFEIGQYEVTQADWREVMGGFPTALGFPGCGDCPVERISWDDIQSFIGKVNAKYGTRYRLPTEEEWEFAARGGRKSKGYKYAGSNNLGAVAWYRNNSDAQTHPVGEKKANELGLYDMSGNVFEWCQDKYGAYPNCPEPAQTTSNRVYRGGNWEFYEVFNPVSFRDSKPSNSRSSGVGFRLAR